MTEQEAINDLKMSLRMWGRKPQKERFCSCCGQALDWSSENENTAEN